MKERKKMKEEFMLRYLAARLSLSIYAGVYECSSEFCFVFSLSEVKHLFSNFFLHLPAKTPASAFSYQKPPDLNHHIPAPHILTLISQAHRSDYWFIISVQVATFECWHIPNAFRC